MLRALLAFSAVVALAAPVAIVACGTDAVGVDACRQIEEARCRVAPSCPDISLSEPLHPGGASNDVASCIQYYDDACLHGLSVGSDPGQVAVTQCIAAIDDGGCTIVEHPEQADACAWLVPTTVDASTDGDDGGDSGDDGTDGADTGDDGT